MLQSIAQEFLNYASTIIAKQAVLAIFNLFGGGGVSPKSGGGGLENVLKNPDFLKYSNFANGGVMTDHGPLKLQKYARGGIASSPQLAMYGEGSMPEAYVPLPDGRSIPVSLRLPYQGKGGDAAPLEAPYQAKGGDAAPLALPFDKRASTISGLSAVAQQQAAMDAMAAAEPLRIEYSRVGAGDLPFVTEEQHQRGMAQAAQAAEAATLRRLRTSPATRRRVGV
jgi:hypothetical protein